jgi:hypothetical protein
MAGVLGSRVKEVSACQSLVYPVPGHQLLSNVVRALLHQFPRFRNPSRLCALGWHDD